MNELKTILGVNEAYEVTEVLETLVLDSDKLHDLCEQMHSDYSVLMSYYQETTADRSDLSQDFTPWELAVLLAKLTKPANTVRDICAGIGGLSVAQWHTNPNAHFYCDEFSRPATALLLVNLAMRNMRATVRHMDVLTKRVLNVYEITPSDKYSTITKTQTVNISLSDVIVTNPPYSATWQPKNDERFDGYDLAPKSKADFAFILDGLYSLADDGEMVAIFPHGVLFRGQKEGNIRKRLIENNYLDAVIGLPVQLFIKTQIPVCLLVFKKNRTTKDVLFIDASNDFEKGKNQNRLTDEHVAKIIETYKNRQNVDKYAHVASLDEIIANDYNLNIPRYVDTYEPEPELNLEEIMDNLLLTQQQIKKASQEILDNMKLLKCTNPVHQAEYDRAVQKFAMFVNPPTSAGGEPMDVESMINQTEQQIAHLKQMKAYFMGAMFV